MDPRLQSVLLAVHIAAGAVGLASGLFSMASRKGARVHRFALIAPIAITAAALWLAVSVGGFQIVYIFTAVALIAAAGDVRMIRAGGLTPNGRLARHLWRMGVAFTVSVMAFFVGQQEYLPKAVQGTVLVGAPALIALSATLFWLVQRTWPKRRRAAAIA
ncbi:hypothetical protein P7B02_17400 [Caulobacter segnis]|uniref:hypothetical protein n=1 Tax=Caulobacter segnis TaxID=88688 RepID=UPI00241081DA|nr:hypothetical protein [Caulobacter segnis]MDG2523309.1 hypothetical protein [Caulobacter segnis]